MGNQEDKAFMKTFGLIILSLVLFTFVIIFIANFTAGEPVEDSNPSRTALAFERTSPIGNVRTSADDPVSVSTPSTSVASAGAGSMPVEGIVEGVEAAVTASIDGSAIYASACQACHMTGAAGAPMPGSDLWAERAAKGLETLSSHAINGFNAMPAKGGRMDLSDDEVIAAVEFMLAQQ